MARTLKCGNESHVREGERIARASFRRTRYRSRQATVFERVTAADKFGDNARREKSFRPEQHFKSRQNLLRGLISRLATHCSKFVASFAGDSEKAHVKGCKFVLNISQAKNSTDRAIMTNDGSDLQNQKIS